MNEQEKNNSDSTTQKKVICMIAKKEDLQQLNERPELRKNNLTVKRIHPNELTEPEKDKLIDELFDVAVDAFGKTLPYEAINGRTRTADVVLTINNEQGRILGYAVNEHYLLNNMSVNYFNTALFRREIQGKGIYTPVNEYRTETIPGAKALLTRTQNPQVYQAMNKLSKSKNLELHPNGTAIPLEARLIVQDYDKEVDDHLVTRGIYFGRSLMDDTPRPTTPDHERLWSYINVDKGDAIYIVAMQRKEL